MTASVLADGHGEQDGAQRDRDQHQAHRLVERVDGSPRRQPGGAEALASAAALREGAT